LPREEKSLQGIESLTQAQADEVQATNLGHASADLFEAVERATIRAGSSTFRS
jgi:catalase